MLTETGLFWLGFAAYTTGAIMAGVSIGRFREYRRTKKDSSLYIAIGYLFTGFVLAVVAKLLWQYTPIGAFLIY